LPQVAYVNSDSNGRGFLSAGGSHTLELFVDEVARDVVDPQTKVSVQECVKTLPGIREAIEQRRWSEVPAQIENVARTLDGYSAELERLAAGQ